MKLKLKKRTKNLHGVLKTCEKIIEFFYHSCRVFIKTLGKVLYNLVFKIDFNFKGLINELTKYDKKEIHNYVGHLERNEFLKKNKMLRKMQAKVNFYDKLETPKYEKAYKKIAFSLKHVEDVDKNLNLSRFTENSMCMSTLSRNQSYLLRNNNQQYSINESINPDTTNFLDALDSNNPNTSMVQRPQNLLDMIQKLNEKFKTEKFSEMNFVTSEIFIKKMQDFITLFEESILTINVDPKNRNDHVKVKSNRAEQNYDFYRYCLEELKEKVSFCNSKFQLMQLLIKNRGISFEEKEQSKLYDILTKDKTMQQENTIANQEEIDKLELLKMIETSYLEKKAILDDKKNFIKKIDEVVAETKTKLGGVFENLNNYEDKYMLNINIQKENQKKIELNKIQIDEIKRETMSLRKEMISQDRELRTIGTKLSDVEQIKKDVEDNKNRFGGEKKEMEIKIKEFEEEVIKMTEHNIKTEIYIIELEEAEEYMKEIYKSKIMENQKLNQLKAVKEKEFDELLQKVLKSHLKL